MIGCCHHCVNCVQVNNGEGECRIFVSSLMRAGSNIPAKFRIQDRFIIR